MNMNWDDIAKKPKKTKEGKQFRSATDELDTKTVRKATGREKAQKGRKQYPLTTRLPDELAGDILEAIKGYAAQFNMAQNDVQLLCLMRGLNSLAESPPEVEVEPKAKPILPEL